MEINELRIGNLIKSKIGDTESIGTITEIREDSVWFTIKQTGLFSYNLPIKYINPIDLSGEWLRSFGFSQTENGDGLQGGSGDRFSIKLISDIIRKPMQIYSTGGSFFYEGVNDIPIKYVHQLQNLYFALTNNELK